MKYIISTDSTADLPDSYIKEHGLVIQFLSYSFGDTTYSVDKQLSTEEFYRRMRNGEMPTTSASVPSQVEESFEEWLTQGYDVLHFSFSSALSSSYNSACMAANELKERYSDRKIIVVDTLCASLGQGLLVYHAVARKEAGASIEELADWANNNKLHLCHQFTVDDLFNLHRGGRVSKATAIIGTLLSIKPVLHVDNEGHLVSLCNVRNRKKSLIRLVDNMAEQIEGYDNPIIFISHGDCIEDAEFVAQQVRERFGIQSFIINPVSPTIGAHSGPGTVALFFFGKNR